jgi:hypothetical protein
MQFLARRLTACSTKALEAFNATGGFQTGFLKIHGFLNVQVIV